LEADVATNLQDFTDQALSNEFKELFSTEAFADVIEKWFIGASKSVVGIIENATNASVDDSDPETMNQIDNQFATVESLLFQAIWKKQDLLRSTAITISIAELDFINPTYGNHEKLCIFDWVHEYSSIRFSRAIDYEMIHLIFDIMGISTYCLCDFLDVTRSQNSFDVNARIMSEPLDFLEEISVKEKNYERWTRVMRYFRSDDGIDLWKIDH